MLVCSHCQFENPDTHKYCQGCGTSLTEKECPTCGALVPLNAEYCLQCGAVTGTIWKAILSAMQAEVDSAPSTPIDPLVSHTRPMETLPLPTGKFLDSQQRYQLLELLPQFMASGVEIETRVLDHLPLQPSGLTSAALPLPPIAQTYRDLQAQFPLLPFPRLHDAWQQDSLNVLLLQDRSPLPTLLDVLFEETVLPLQILHWLHETAELWEVLEPYHCCRSLFKLGNVRVDEDYLLCLEQLHYDLPHQPTQLAELGHFWQKLFHQSQQTQQAEIAQLCSELESGVIDSIDQLRSRVEAIATILQSDHAAMTAEVSPPDDEAPFLQTAFVDPDTMPDQQQVEQFAVLPSQPFAVAPQNSLNVIDEITVSDPEDDNDNDDSPTIVLGMRLVSLEDAGQTDIGRQRNHNEDCFSIQTEITKSESPYGRSLHAKGLYILCDGMGGHASGEVASATAVETLQRYFAARWHDRLPNEATISEAVQEANRVLYDLNQENASAGSGRMGTTLVLVLIHNADAVVAHVGDSRLYRLSRRRGLQQLTTDHEVGQREIQRGVEPALAYARPDAYQLTQALGPRDENFLSPDIKFLELNEDGVLLLCSDGLSDNNLLETHYQSHLEPLLDQRTNLEQGVNQLIELANQYNGHDNITALAVRIKVRPNLEQLPQL